MEKDRTLISVKNLDAFYSKNQILKNLSFDLKSGELVCLCGPNGCGKSTLLSVLANVQHGSLIFSKNAV
nr:ABC transporter ATP-binding protein [Treponemataceae bacterium]